MDNQQNMEIVIDYKGAKLADHTMDLGEFINSVSGLKQLLEIIAQEYKIPSESFGIDIASIENGCIKAKIIPFIKWSGKAAIAGIIGNASWNIIIPIYNNTIEFINAKRSADTDEYFNKNISNISPIQARLYLNPLAHSSVNKFSQCLVSEVEEIEMFTDNNPENSITLYSHDRKSLEIDPFDKNNIKGESSETINMQLYLDGAHLSKDSKWQFIDKSKRKNKNINAVVLDDFLLTKGIQQALIDFKDEPLLCTVIVKTTKKESAKRATKNYFITKCSLNNNLLSEIND